MKTKLFIFTVLLFVLLVCDNEDMENESNIRYIEVNVENGSKYVSKIDSVFLGIGDFFGNEDKMIVEETVEITNNEPSGMKWYFVEIPDGYYGSILSTIQK